MCANPPSKLCVSRSTNPHADAYFLGGKVLRLLLQFSSRLDRMVLLLVFGPACLVPGDRFLLF